MDGYLPFRTSHALLNRFNLYDTTLKMTPDMSNRYDDITLVNYISSEFWHFFNIIFVSSHMYPENPEGTQVIVGSMNMGYISDTARNRTHNLFRPKREPIPLGHSDGHLFKSFIFFFLQGLPQSGLWNWIDTVLIPNLYYTNSYNGNQTDDYDQGFTIDSFNFRLGPPRIRQLRVKNG